MSRSPVDYLRHILDEVEYLEEQSKALSKKAFLEDETLKRAFVRSLEIIGEAAKNLPREFCDQYPNVPWRALARMRDRLIHGYFGVDYDIVWDVIESKIPELRSTLLAILKDLKFEPPQL